MKYPTQQGWIVPILMIVAIPILIAACGGSTPPRPPTSTTTNLVPVDPVVTLGKFPDLVPVENRPQYCELSSRGSASRTLLTFVKNQGDKAAQESILRVEYDGITFTDTRTVPVLGPGISEMSLDTAIEVIHIPDEAWNNDLVFTITVDFEDVVNESNEDNNVVHGKCIG